MATLDETQKATLSKWIDEGETLGRIQSKLKSEFGVSMTFMEVRFLIDDLGLELKSEPASTGPGEGVDKDNPAKATQKTDAELLDEDEVSVDVDSIVTPGAVVSGSVRFSDGVQAQWQVDQLGRLGLSGVEQGYQPSPQDVEKFQSALQDALKKKGMA